MHPLLDRRQLFAAYLASWLLLGALTAFLLAGADPLRWGPAAALGLPMAVLFGLLGLASYYPCRAHPLRRGSTLWLLFVHVGAAVLTSGLWLGAGTLLARSLTGLGKSLALPSLEAVAPLAAEVSPTLFGLGLLFYLLAAGFHYLLLAFDESRVAAGRAMELRALAREAELAALKAQVDPHFLFNSLSSVAYLAGADPRAAREMALSLATFLRSSLSAAKRGSLPLGEEVDLALTYLGIERVRFGDRLQVDVEVEEDARAWEAPPLLLLPLVENAVRHGIAPRVEGGEVSIRATTDGDRLTLEVSNPCDPSRLATSPGEGLGLPNVQRRLELLYGRSAHFSARREEEQFQVRLSFPRQRPPGPHPS